MTDAAATLAAPERAVQVGGRVYPVVLPSIRDARLHLASVIITIHVLGQLAFGFHVSVPQITIAILTCAVIELVHTARREGSIVWPASAMLTGSGIGLILRVVGTERGDHWTFDGWYWYAGIACIAMASKYLIRWNGGHVFNPSNVALVAAFLVAGGDRIEPLDFWWSPLDGPMLLAYGVIIAGGVAITGRLSLLAMGAAFWLAFAASTGVVAASGHAITTRWAFDPVSGASFWWTIVTSPEVLIFLFFMLTDPRTVPQGRVARLVFGVSVGLVATLLLAPQRTEFGAKVAVLGALTIACPLRYALANRLPAPCTTADVPGRWFTAAFGTDVIGRRWRSSTAAVRALCVAPLLAGVFALAGTPARRVVTPLAEAARAAGLAVRALPRRSRAPDN